jgi:hypothetical protein
MASIFRQDLEHLEQKALIEWWDLAHFKYKLPIRALFAIPNGGKRDKGTAVKLKLEGVRAGTADLMLCTARGKFNGLWIEMKSLKGAVSADQNEFIDFARSQGYSAHVCYGWIEAKKTIEGYLK